MAYNITDFDGGVIAPGGAYPYGDIKDNPTGTRVNRKSNADMQQFFQKLMAAAGVTPNSLPDNVTNTYQLYLSLLRIISSEVFGSLTSKAWISGVGLTLTANLGATVSATTTVVNRYAQIGKTRIWSVSLTGVTITGSPSEIYVALNPSTGGSWHVPGIIQPGFYIVDACYVRLATGDDSVIIRRSDGANFATGAGGQIHFTITAETN